MNDNVKETLTRLTKALGRPDHLNRGKVLGLGLAMAVLGAMPTDPDIQRRAIGLDQKKSA